MTPDETTALFQQHAALMGEIQNVYVALAIFAFIGLAFIVLMFGAAAWSVRMVNGRQRELEGKFSLLIDVLLQRARNDIEARAVTVQGQTVVVEEQQPHG